MSEKEQIQELLYQKEMKELEKILRSMREADADTFILSMLIQVFNREEREGIKDTVFSRTVDMDTLVEHFIKVKLLLRRLEFDLPEGYQRELYQYCVEHKVSRCLLAHILVKNLFHRKKVCRKLVVMFPEDAGYFRKVYQYLEGE